ncbi:NUDIX hydrolase [soil metagenome]
MKQLAILNPEGAIDNEIKTWRVREAARAILFDNDGNIALQHVTRDNYFKLPGGGIEAGEDKHTALKRECLEETGCLIEVLDEVGSVVELRKSDVLRQVSYCYVAKVLGEKGQSHFTDKEREEGSLLIWMTYEKAFQTVNENPGNTLESQLFMVPRDLIFLTAAKEYRINN